MRNLVEYLNKRTTKSGLLQGYVETVTEDLEKMSKVEVLYLDELTADRKRDIILPGSAEEAGALAILTFLLEKKVEKINSEDPSS